MKLRARVRIRNTPVERRYTKRQEEKEGNLSRKKKKQETKQGGAREKRQQEERGKSAKARGGAGKATKQEGAREKRQQEKGAQTAVRAPFKKDSFCDGSENDSFGFRLRRKRSDRRFTHGAQRVQKSPPNPLPPPPGKPPPGNP